MFRVYLLTWSWVYLTALAYAQGALIPTPPGLSMILTDQSVYCIYCKSLPDENNKLLHTTPSKKIKMKVEFPLKQSIFWTNKQGVTAQDFITTWNKIKSDPEIKYQLPYKHIAHIMTNKNNDTLIIHFNKVIFNYMHLEHLYPTYSKITNDFTPTLNQNVLENPKSFSYFFEQLGFNLRNPILQDTVLRKALFQAISWDSITKNIKNKYFKDQNEYHATSLPFTKFTQQKIFPPQHVKQLNKIRESLKQHGWEYKNSKLSKHEQVLKLNIHYLDNLPWRKELINNIVQSWSELGVEVRVAVSENSTKFFDTLQRMNYSDLILYSIEVHPALSPNSWLSKYAIPSRVNRYTGQNYTAWRNDKILQALHNLENSIDIKEQQKFYQLINEQYQEEVPAIGFFLYKQSL